jgi:ferritin
MNLSQLRRDSLWAQRQVELGNKNYFNIQREISDLRTAGTIEVSNVIDILQKALDKAQQGIKTIERLYTTAIDATNYAVKARRERGEYAGIIDQAIETVRNCHTAARGIANGNNCNPKIPGIDEGKFLKEQGTKADLAELYMSSINTCVERMQDLIDTLTMELNKAKTNPNSGITINGIPINIKYSRIPQVKLRKIFKTFGDTYDSVKHNTAGEFKDLLEAYQNYYTNTGKGGYLNTLINFYSAMTAMMEFLNDIISYGTFGSMKEEDFVQMVYTAYDSYNNYIDNLFDLTDAMQEGDAATVDQFMSSFAQMTKDMKSSLKNAGKNFDLSVGSYEESAKNNYRPNDYIPNYTRIVKN